MPLASDDTNLSKIYLIEAEQIIKLDFYWRLQNTKILPKVQRALVPFSTINKISIPVINSNFTSVTFKATCHANARAERNFAGSSSYISSHTLRKFSNTWANNKMLR